ncbi:YbfB/YjiJ family MFS transporter [Diaphorobacter aerolatus]|uniref:YbfB/YjiJ family MFS transporter n=1 Tax=Diaphorobacter aerolatus TaxID=1288495 RepID=A0A7H0GKV0_9BURK|nr:YbfB/YjiJ family MFS transporter [Diaphorobacter aerolatus]QNP48916.1 YbfB/YjiJ family MFS transporter [Diaphorobacter aerolatus]
MTAEVKPDPLPADVPSLPISPSFRRPWAIALALSLGAAVALGISRFSYGLLLLPMRDDLGWSYLTAGSMNTANALGYFLGAIGTPWLMRRCGAWVLLMAGTVLAGLFMLASGATTDTATLMLLRVLAGAASALGFVAGGVLVARLASLHPHNVGFLIGLFYSGTGFGIALSALLVPAALGAAHGNGIAHAWQWPWLGLGLACLLAAAVMAWPARLIGDSARSSTDRGQFVLRDFGFGLGSYFMFGAGYIGYMTFVVALLKQQGMSPARVTIFYVLLGVAVLASSRIWARMLNYFKGGESLAILNLLLAVVTALPALTSSVPMVFASGIVFGAAFLSVVAATTTLVRHNLPQAAWTAGISAFTTVFALGQIAGPILVGWIADTSRGLEGGLMVSAACLLLGAGLAMRQKPLGTNA